MCLSKSFSSPRKSLSLALKSAETEDKCVIQTNVEKAVSAKKPKRKRLRKPQKPGITAKNQERQFVVHNYHDHSSDPILSSDEEATANNHHDGKCTFPMKLHKVLDEVELDGLSHIVSWMPHGRCFVIHKPKEFTETVIAKYFRQSKLTSFQRQLNLYGFQRITRGKDAHGYYQEYFLRGRADLAKKMTRVKVKGTRYKAASNPDQEPDFYSMPAVVPEEPPVIPDSSVISTSYLEDYPPEGSTYSNCLDDDGPKSCVLSSRLEVLPSGGVIGNYPVIGDVPTAEHSTPSTFMEHVQVMSKNIFPYPPEDYSSYEELPPEVAEFCADWVATPEESETGSDDDDEDSLALMMDNLWEVLGD